MARCSLFGIFCEPRFNFLYTSRMTNLKIVVFDEIQINSKTS